MGVCAQSNHNIMFALRRKAVESAGRLPAAAGRRTSPYSTAHPEKHGDHGHHHEGPKAESLGTQFYVVLAIVPLSLGVYAASRPSAATTTSIKRDGQHETVCTQLHWRELHSIETCSRAPQGRSMLNCDSRKSSIPDPH